MRRTVRRKINQIGNATCEICNSQTYLVQHHIRGRNIPNPHHYSNLTNICSNCHQLIHRGEIVVENRVMTTTGYIVIWHLKNEQSITGNDASVHLL